MTAPNVGTPVRFRLYGFVSLLDMINFMLTDYLEAQRKIHVELSLLLAKQSAEGESTLDGRDKDRIRVTITSQLDMTVKFGFESPVQCSNSISGGANSRTL